MTLSRQPYFRSEPRYCQKSQTSPSHSPSSPFLESPRSFFKRQRSPPRERPRRSSSRGGVAAMDSRVLEITLISAQGLKPPATFSSLGRPPSFYAVAWADPSTKLRTRSDLLGGASPTWNDRFLFLVPADALEANSSAAVSVEIHAEGAWCLPTYLAGSVRLLLGNHRLLERAPGAPAFAALGVRRPSGRYHGVLNLAVTLLPRVPLLAAEALAARPAVAYRDLMGGGSVRLRRRSLLPPPSPRPLPPLPLSKEAPPFKDPPPLKERNREIKPEDRSGGGGALCGLGFRKIHLSPSDQNLQISFCDDE